MCIFLVNICQIEFKSYCNLKYRVIHKTELLKSAAQPRQTQKKGAYQSVENLSNFFCTRRRGVLAGFTARGIRDETWREQEIRKRSVSWNLPKLRQLWRCNGCFGPCTTQNHLRTKQFVSGAWNSSRVAACALQNKQAGRGHRPRLSSMCEDYSIDICRITKGGHIEHL
jgi:hypothetical protein